MTRHVALAAGFTAAALLTGGAGCTSTSLGEVAVDGSTMTPDGADAATDAASADGATDAAVTGLADIACMSDAALACAAPASACGQDCAPADWATARRTCFGYQVPTGNFAGITPLLRTCTGYDALVVGAIDVGEEYYYDHQSGSLVAVTHEQYNSPPPFYMSCVFGPSCFVVPTDCTAGTECVPSIDAGVGNDANAVGDSNGSQDAIDD